MDGGQGVRARKAAEKEARSGREIKREGREDTKVKDQGQEEEEVEENLVLPVPPADQGGTDMQGEQGRREPDESEADDRRDGDHDCDQDDPRHRQDRDGKVAFQGDAGSEEAMVDTPDMQGKQDIEEAPRAQETPSIRSTHCSIHAKHSSSEGPQPPSRVSADILSTTTVSPTSTQWQPQTPTRRPHTAQAPAYRPRPSRHLTQPSSLNRITRFLSKNNISTDTPAGPPPLPPSPACHPPLSLHPDSPPNPTPISNTPNKHQAANKRRTSEILQRFRADVQLEVICCGVCVYVRVCNCAYACLCVCMCVSV